jgi:hypothetical protein
MLIFLPQVLQFDFKTKVEHQEIPSTSIIAHPLNQMNEMEFSTSVHSTMVFLHHCHQGLNKSKERAICIQLHTQPSHSTNGLPISTQ